MTAPPRLAANSAARLASSGWRDVIGHTGYGSLEEAIAGRGPEGFIEAHLADLERQADNVSIHAPTCVLIEWHGLSPVVLASMAGRLDQGLRVVDSQDRTILEMTGRSATIALTRDGLERAHVRAVGAVGPVIANLPAVPEAIAAGAKTRSLHAVLSHEALDGQTLVVERMVNDRTDPAFPTSSVWLRDVARLDGPGLAERHRKRHGRDGTDRTEGGIA